MIKRALKLREQLDTFSIRNRKKLDKDFLSEQEWDELDAIHNILRPFKRVTKRLEGHAEAGESGSIWESLPALETLLSHVELMKTEYAAHKPIATSLNEAWSKLRDYYEKMDESPAYAAALMLHPRYKLNYFHKRWKTHLAEFIQPTIKTLQRLYEEEYGSRYPIQSKITLLPFQKGIDPLQDFLDKEVDEDSEHDQFQAYNNLQPEPLPLGESIFQWWARRKSQFPALCKESDLF